MFYSGNIVDYMGLGSTDKAAAILPQVHVQIEAQVEISGEDAFAELVNMAIQVDPSLAERGAQALAGARGGAASVVGQGPFYFLCLLLLSSSCCCRAAPSIVSVIR